MSQPSAMPHPRGASFLPQLLACSLALALPAHALALQESAEPAAQEVEFTPTKEQNAITRDVAERLAKQHLVRTEIDDALSQEVFERYLEFLDPTRTHFIASDVAEFRKWRHALDEALVGGDLGPAFEMFERYQARRIERLEMAAAMVAEGGELPTYGPGTQLDLEREEAPWPKDEAELHELWRKLLASEVLELELAGREGDKLRELLVKRYEDRLTRTRQTNGGDIVRVFLNAFAQSLDPHTEYFPPKAAEDFDIEMSLSVEGIGALLGNDGVYTRIERLLPGGPAEASGKLEATDRLIAVAQGEDGEWVDILGWRVDEVAEHVRGERGTTVRLQVLSAEQAEGSAPREVRIVREKVKLEERAATSEVIEVEGAEGAQRIGVIDLPAFYLDFEARSAGDKEYRSSTRDVERLVRELMAQGVDGIVLDLRANGGGSLDEAVGVAELFLGTLPIVQISGREGVQQLEGSREAVYNGPFAVLIDRLSASASEILAGAVHDHGRGPVIGTRTFGKGTVQVLAPALAGELKVTRAMFYRPSGASTQHRGIEPDIALPSQYDEDLIGESALPHALPFDEIRPVPDLDAGTIGLVAPELARLHGERATSDPGIEHLNARLALIEELRARTTVSLDKDERRAENEAVEARWLAIENDWRAARGLEPVESLDDEAEAAEGEADEAPVSAEDPHDDEPDALAEEAAAVLADYIRMLKLERVTRVR